MHRWGAAYTEAGSEVTDAGGVALLEDAGVVFCGDFVREEGEMGGKEGGVERALGGGYRAGVMIASYMNPNNISKA